MEKTNLGLVEYAKAQLNLPYWYGAFGQIASESLYRYKKAQYPSYYTASDFPNQYGKKVHDCVGLIKGYLWSDTPTSPPTYKPSQDVSANGMLSKCIEKGKIATLPNIPGILVFMNKHVGVYIGDGYVIEARGHAYGIVKTKLSSRPWHSWGKCPYITYITDSEKKPHEADKAKSKNLQYNKSYTVTASRLNMRAGAGTNKDIITTLKKGDKFRCYGYYTRNDSTIWLLGTDANGNTGFCSYKYLA